MASERTTTDSARPVGPAGSVAAVVIPSAVASAICSTPSSTTAVVLAAAAGDEPLVLAESISKSWPRSISKTPFVAQPRRCRFGLLLRVSPVMPPERRPARVSRRAVSVRVPVKSVRFASRSWVRWSPPQPALAVLVRGRSSRSRARRAPAKDEPSKTGNTPSTSLLVSPTVPRFGSVVVEPLALVAPKPATSTCRDQGCPSPRVPA